MPYKRKEDRAAAARRYRERKKGLKVAGVRLIEDDGTLGDFLREMGFNEISFEYLLEDLKTWKKDMKGNWYRDEGKRVYPPKQMFFGWNTMIIGDDIG